MATSNVKTFRRNLAWKTFTCFSRRLKKAEYRLKTELKLMKANFKVHPKLLCQLVNTTSFNKLIAHINRIVWRYSSFIQSSCKTFTPLSLLHARLLRNVLTFQVVIFQVVVKCCVLYIFYNHIFILISFI